MRCEKNDGVDRVDNESLRWPRPGAPALRTREEELSTDNILHEHGTACAGADRAFAGGVHGYRSHLVARPTYEASAAKPSDSEVSSAATPCWPAAGASIDVAAIRAGASPALERTERAW